MGACVEGSCEQGDSASMEMMGSAWIRLNSVLPALNGSVTLQSGNYKESTALQIKQTS